jgi:glycosyltransferase involved in cell wall biosynthesis
LYISSSLSEGLPLSVLEAVNYGVPCLLSSIRPHIEISQELNVEGVECFDLTTNELHSKIDKSLSKSFDNSLISQKAHCYYSSEIMTKKYEDEYQKFIVWKKSSQC